MTTTGSKAPEAIATKLGVSNYIGDPTLPYNLTVMGQLGLNNAGNITVCHFLFFIFSRFFTKHADCHC